MSAADPTQSGSTGRGDASGAGQPRRRRFRLRVHIATLFVALIAAAGLAIIGYGYRATSRLLLSAGDAEFLHVAEHTADQVRNLLAPASLLVGLLTRHPLTQTTSLAARLESLPLLAAALTAHPEISAVYIGFANGDFFLVRSLSDAVRQGLGAPAGATFLVQSLAATDRPTPGRYLYLDGQLALVRNEPRPNYRFDPHTRDWYRQAVVSATLIRTSPYVFFTTARDRHDTRPAKRAGRDRRRRRHHAPGALPPPCRVARHPFRADRARRPPRLRDRSSRPGTTRSPGAR